MISKKFSLSKHFCSLNQEEIKRSGGQWHIMSSVQRVDSTDCFYTMKSFQHACSRQKAETVSPLCFHQVLALTLARYSSERQVNVFRVEYKARDCLFVVLVVSCWKLRPPVCLHPLHLQVSKEAHKRVVWMWNDTFCTNAIWDVVYDASLVYGNLNC